MTRKVFVVRNDWTETLRISSVRMPAMASKADLVLRERGLLWPRADKLDELY
jgi:hypothetical protein